MLRTRAIALVAILVLLLAGFGLMGCSSDDDAAEETATTTEESATEESPGTEADGAIVGTWENADAASYPSITFVADGTGMISDIDGEEAAMEWTIEDDYLEITLEYDGMTETTGGGFFWNEEGSEFSWDADGTYTKVE